MFQKYQIKDAILLLVISLSVVSALKFTSRPCWPVQAKYGINCECNEEYCDTLNIPDPQSENQFVMVTSSESGYRFAYKYGHFTEPSDLDFDDETNILWVEKTVKHRNSKILGFGGGWTGAVRHILSKFPRKLRHHLYKSYYSLVDGIGYNLLRIPIAGVDFDLKPWTYDMQTEPDPNLLNFTELNGWEKLRNSQIKEMMDLTHNSDIKVLAASWSPPRWMKAKQQWYGAADNQLLPEYYEAFAKYHAKWLNFTNADGIRVWSLSTGNEPNYAKLYQCDFIGGSWEAGNQADWLVDNLAPALQQTGLDVKVHIYDDMRNGSIKYLREMIKRQPYVMKYADVIAMHPYFDSETSPEILDILHRIYEKQIIYSEMSFFTMLPGSWSRAEEMISILMDALLHNVAAYVDWNLILDKHGGPAYTNGNGVLDAFIVSNKDYTKFYKQPLFYAMAHFAKFIPRHSLRINGLFFGAQKSHVQTLAYLRPDNKTTIILYNNHTNSIHCTLIDKSKGASKLILKPKSLNTIVY